MCGRFTLRTPLARLLDQFQATLQRQFEFSASYNIAPTQTVVAVRAGAAKNQRELVGLHWGLVPSWADGTAIGNRMINARSESVAEKPSFRSAFKKRRCLILTDGYYEWQKQGAKKQPYLIHRPDDQPFAFAGLWESWRGDGRAEPLESCTIITTDANETTRAIHDRMPVILSADEYDRWLDTELQDRQQLESLLNASSAPELIAEPVSTYVNSPRNNDARCVARLGD